MLFVLRWAISAPLGSSYYCLSNKNSFFCVHGRSSLHSTNWVTILNTVWHILDCMENIFFNLLLMDFKHIKWINSNMLYVVTYFKISTFVHTFFGDNMHCKVLCIVHYWVGPLSCVQQLWFFWKPNFRGGREAVSFSQIILYQSYCGWKAAYNQFLKIKWQDKDQNPRPHAL